MRRWLRVVSAFLIAFPVAAAGVGAVPLPRAWAGDAPIGHIGDTLRVDNGTFIADVTVSSVAPCDPPRDSATPARAPTRASPAAPSTAPT